MRARAGILVLLFVAASCEGGDSDFPSGLPVVDVVVSQGAARVTIHAEVAATPADRSRGLMARPSLARDAGMLFTFQDPVSIGFWMKDTLIPLDIAFISDDVIHAIFTMQPCRAEPCPLTRPAGPYERALEVNAGTFGSAGITEGATIEIKGTLPTPR